MNKPVKVRIGHKKDLNTTPMYPRLAKDGTVSNCLNDMSTSLADNPISKSDPNLKFRRNPTKINARTYNSLNLVLRGNFANSSGYSMANIRTLTNAKKAMKDITDNLDDFNILNKARTSKKMTRVSLSRVVDK